MCSKKYYESEGGGCSDFVKFFNNELTTVYLCHFFCFENDHVSLLTSNLSVSLQVLPRDEAAEGSRN